MNAPAAPLAVVQQVYGAMAKGDVPTLLMLAAPDSTWTVHAPADHPYGGVFRGQGGMARFLSQLKQHAQLLEFVPMEFHVAGDQVFVVGRERIRWKPDGGEFGASWMQRWRVKDGKVVVFEEWTDTASGLAARR